MIDYYGIKNPEGNILFISHSHHDSWMLFFEKNTHRRPICTAIEAYQAIGYKCVKIKIIEISEDTGEEL